MVSTATESLLIATSNPGKREEFARLVPSGIRLLTLNDVLVDLPPENGTSFTEIATTKALAAARQSDTLTLADDSGLEVDALGGAPGIYSARFAGEPASDERNRQKLLAALSRIEPANRTARFRCAVALARPGHLIATAEGTCEGAIATSPRGEHGFGYDPLFLFPDGHTMAELSPEEKDEISHRGRAFRAILPALLATLEDLGQWGARQ